MIRTSEVIRREMKELNKKIEAHQAGPNCAHNEDISFKSQEELESGVVCVMCESNEDEYNLLHSELTELRYLFIEELKERGWSGIKSALDIVKPIDKSSFYHQFYSEVEWRIESERKLQEFENEDCH